MNNRKESRVYRRVGSLVLAALLVLLLLPLFFVPSEKLNPSCQEYKVRGIDVKENNRGFKNFLAGIKENNGVLVLGSSETGAFGKENYHGLLNEYFNCGHVFSVMGGAGRTAHVYYPAFLNNKELFRGMKVLYFVNPTYWRESLNYFQLAYYERYNSRPNLLRAKDELIEYGLYKEYGGELLNKNLSTYLTGYLEYARSYFIRTKNDITAVELTTMGCIERKKRKEVDSTLIMNQLKELNLEKNISKEFDEKDPEKFVKIKKSDFQLNALQGFNSICQDLEIEIVYILGPYNGIYCKKYSPEYCSDHESVIHEIKEFFEKNNSDYIDCSDLSYVPGSFIDVQHHSKYAAWIIADRISEYYEKNR